MKYVFYLYVTNTCSCTRSRLFVQEDLSVRRPTVYLPSDLGGMLYHGDHAVNRQNERLIDRHD